MTQELIQLATRFPHRWSEEPTFTSLERHEELSADEPSTETLSEISLGIGEAPTIQQPSAQPPSPEMCQEITAVQEIPEEISERATTGLLPRGHLGLLEPLLEIPGLTDIFVNAPESVWYEAAGQTNKSDLVFAGEADVRELATRLLTSSGSLLDAAHPSGDVQTVRGHRVHAVLPPLSPAGTLLTIRLQPQERLSLSALKEQGMFSDNVENYLHQMMVNHQNFLVTGGTGTGKTTLLNAMLGICPENERILTIEDTPELKVDHPHVVSLTSQQANSEGTGAVELADLIKQSLRMRPHRLVLGECRGAEIADMLTAMNTGHRGTGGTLHANSADAVPARLYALGALAGMPKDALTLQAATAFDLVIHIERRAGRRYVQAISRLHEEHGALVTRPLCEVELGRSHKLLENWYDNPRKR